MKQDGKSYIANMEWKETGKHKNPFGNDGIRVEIAAEIRNNLTGEIRLHMTDGIMEEGDDHPNAFIWEEGNYACDCNREIFFFRAGGERTPDEESACTDDRYSVNLVNPITGKAFYEEFRNGQREREEKLKQIGL